jgi:hypothetical protein
VRKFLAAAAAAIAVPIVFTRGGRGAWLHAESAQPVQQLRQGRGEELRTDSVRASERRRAERLPEWRPRRRQDVRCRALPIRPPRRSALGNVAGKGPDERRELHLHVDADRRPRHDGPLLRHQERMESQRATHPGTTPFLTVALQRRAAAHGDFAFGQTAVGKSGRHLIYAVWDIADVQPLLLLRGRDVLLTPRVCQVFKGPLPDRGWLSTPTRLRIATRTRPHPGRY